MPRTFEITERRVRVEVDGEPRWGRRAGERIVLDDGGELDEADALYLAPAEPTKILAVHLTYRSRIEEYAARMPPEPSYFVKPPTTLNGHRRPSRWRGARGSSTTRASSRSSSAGA
jgi:5-oxopent-3-ene-1,2,5-tricarboxylate decarboxylase/2-hydroxyhepta-2,4-diene-1,7-dioate isomerase